MLDINLTIMGFFMANITAEDRIQIVLRYLNGIESIQEIARQVQVNKSIVSGWIRLYEQHGSKAFLKNYTTYSTQFKMDVLNYMNDTGTSSIDAAAIFNISSPGMIRNWRTKWKQGGIDALQSKKKGRPSMKKETKKSESKKVTPTPVEGTVEALQAKIERLEMENAYLKKLNSLVQMQEKLQIKSKRK
jgi:transposase-like protein